MNSTIKSAFFNRFPNAIRLNVIRKDDETVRVIVTLRDHTRLSFTFEVGSDDDEYVFANDQNPADIVRAPF